MPTLRQTNSFSPGIYRGHKFDIDRLKRFVEGTNKAIEAGVSIPLLMEHAPINASDADTLAFAQQPQRGAGWVTKFDLDDNGGLTWEAKDVPADVQRDVEGGALKFTSPEFREAYTSEKEGVYDGPIIRHMAITAKPGNPHQGPIETIALQEQTHCFQFGEEEFEPLALAEEVHTAADGYSVGKRVKQKSTGLSGEVVAVDGNKYKIMVDGMGDEPHDIDYEDLMDSEDSPPVGKGPSQHAELPPKAGKFGKPESDLPDDPEVITEIDEAPESEPVNPDMPPKATDKSKLAAVIAGLAQKNIVLPSDWSPDNDAAMDILLGCLNSSIKAEQAKEAEESDVDQEEQPVKDSSMPFSENDHHKILTKHGYSKGPNDAAGYEQYNHPAGHVVAISDGDWMHGHGGMGGYVKGRYKTGNGVSSLSAHLEKVHSTQHTEVQFTEEELVALGPKARQAIEAGITALAASRKAEEEAQAKAVQFAEQAKVTANNAAKYKTKVAIEGMRIPPSLKAQLVKEEHLQFSEAVEQPLFTPSQVAKLFEEHVPPALQFLEGATKNTEDPLDLNGNRVEQFFEKGNVPTGHISAERAEQLIAESPVFKFNNPLSNGSMNAYVAKENGKHPNNVMRN